jgi:asparagine synthase (glutamine-hydrolysing)
MCGIAGIAWGRAGIRDSVERMLCSLEHRGPDSGGIHEFESAVLGHRRLAIFDLSAAGHQPMLDRDRGVGIVFNGAIYNFRELRGELQSAGFDFVSETDTEVLVLGYRAWGIDELVRRIRGMFAFALWDERDERLFLVRDRLGVKPLVYCHRNGTLAFASTAAAMRSAGVTGAIDPAAIGEFLQFGFITESNSIYEGVSKLPPASIAECTREGVRVRQYWTQPEPDTLRISFEDAVEETERLFLRAVESRLHADVPVAALLSGGIDSSLVCWAVKFLGADLRAFTIGTPGSASDESADAVATAKTLGIRHQILPLTDELDASEFPLSSAFAEPFACGSALGMLRLAKTIRETDARVLLTGDGGDDAFLGYPRHRLLWQTEKIARRTPPWVAASWRAVRPNRSKGPAKRFVHLVDYVTGGLGGFLQANPGIADFEAHHLLGERMLDRRVWPKLPAPSLASARSALRDYLEFDRRTQFVSEYLNKVDGATMQYALEARSPFLDHNLWEFAGSIPAAVHFSGGYLKAILREIARRRIDERTAHGRKRGFTVPVESWLANRWAEKTQELLLDPLIVRDGWVDGRGLTAELRTLGSSGVASRRLWFLFVLEQWMQHNHVRQPEPNISRVRLASSTSPAA